MALNEEQLKSLILEKMADAGIDTGNEFFQGDKIAFAIAYAVIEHIKSEATVAVPAAGLVAPNGPVTGAATGTIS